MNTENSDILCGNIAIVDLQGIFIEIPPPYFLEEGEFCYVRKVYIN